MGMGAGTVSVLRKGDEVFHYTDGSHRWIARSGDQEAWNEAVRQHLEAHRNEGMPRRRQRSENACDVEETP